MNMNIEKIYLVPEVYNNHIFRSFVDEPGNPWFIAADVCEIIDIKNVTAAVQQLDEDEKASQNLGLPGGSTNIISESGLYTLIIRSNKPEAKVFRKWVTSEVLPAIRKTGRYISPAAVEHISQLLQTEIVKMLPAAMKDCAIEASLFAKVKKTHKIDIELTRIIADVPWQRRELLKEYCRRLTEEPELLGLPPKEGELNRYESKLDEIASHLNGILIEYKPKQLNRIMMVISKLHRICETYPPQKLSQKEVSDDLDISRQTTYIMLESFIRSRVVVSNRGYSPGPLFCDLYCHLRDNNSARGRFPILYKVFLPNSINANE